MSDQPSRNDQQEHDRRVATILKQARRETGVRDLLAFALAKMWTALLGVGAVVYSFFSKSHLPPVAEPKTSVKHYDS